MTGLINSQVPRRHFLKKLGLGEASANYRTADISIRLLLMLLSISELKQ